MSKSSMTLILTVFLLLGSCSHQPSYLKNTSDDASLSISLIEKENSAFGQIQAEFTTTAPLLLVYRVISDLSLTAQWFDRLNSIELLESINNNRFLLRTTLSSPWPFMDRELITCVTTISTAQQIQIKMTACPNSAPSNVNFVRIQHAQSLWQITPLKNGLTKVKYQAWIDPEGNVLATFFNRQLSSSSRKSLMALQRLITAASPLDYPY